MGDQLQQCFTADFIRIRLCEEGLVGFNGVREFLWKLDIFIQHLEKLLAGASAFKDAFGLEVVDGYIEFPGANSYLAPGLGKWEKGIDKRSSSARPCLPSYSKLKR